MKIRELAELSHCSTETIRYYERIGLLPEAARNASNYRVYSFAHAQRLRFIRNCRSLDMTHEEIRELLNYIDAPPNDCTPVTQLLVEHIRHVDVRLQALNELKQQLEQLAHFCDHPGEVQDCGILCQLFDMEPEKLKPNTHVS